MISRCWKIALVMCFFCSSGEALSISWGEAEPLFYRASWRSEFRWPGTTRLEYVVSLDVPGNDVAALSRGYGWERKECDSIIDSVLICEADRLPHVSVSRGGSWPEFTIESVVAGNVDTPKADAAVAVCKRKVRAGLKSFYRGRGFMVRPAAQVDTLQPDYAGVLKRQRSLLEGLSDALLASIPPRYREDDERRLAAALSFVQHLDYGEIAEWVDGVFVGHWFPPLEVLRREFGDCDSKVMILLGIWHDWNPEPEKQPALLTVRMGRGLHVVVGFPMEGPEYPYVRREQLGSSGFWYVICDVTVKRPPGMIPKEVDRALDLEKSAGRLHPWWVNLW
jgi:hypothetical protein